jgi:hypothetical protein
MSFFDKYVFFFDTNIIRPGINFHSVKRNYEIYYVTLQHCVLELLN